jgi:KDO2-lipid IV(A) lauroyltransferase
MSFFGRPAPIPTGPAQMALRMGTPLIPACVYRLPDDSYVAEAGPMVIAERTGDDEADEARVTQQLLGPIEEFIRQHPEQWHVPHRIWEGGP